MRFMNFAAIGALSLLGLMGCSQGQPRIYRVAMDMTPVKAISVSSCFRGNILPICRGTLNELGYRAEDEWVIWTGVEQTEYLDLGSQTFNLGDAPTITVSGLIEGKDKVFAAARNESKPIGDQFTEVRKTLISVTFNDYSAAPTGKMDLTAEYACAPGRIGCPTGDSSAPDSTSCTSSVSFVARRIDAQQMTFYNNNP